MAPTKEISEDLRERVVDPRQAGKGNKTISKEFGLHHNPKSDKFKMHFPLSRSAGQQRSLGGLKGTLGNF